MTRYRKKPVEVEAWQVGSDSEPPEWVDVLEKVLDGPADFYLPGWGSVQNGDWIVMDYELVYVVDPEAFEQAYEVVE